MFLFFFLFVGVVWFHGLYISCWMANFGNSVQKTTVVILCGEMTFSLLLSSAAAVRAMLDKSGFYVHVPRRNVCATIHHAVNLALQSVSDSLEVSESNALFPLLRQPTVGGPRTQKLRFCLLGIPSHHLLYKLRSCLLAIRNHHFTN